MTKKCVRLDLYRCEYEEPKMARGVAVVVSFSHSMLKYSQYSTLSPGKRFLFHLLVHGFFWQFKYSTHTEKQNNQQLKTIYETAQRCRLGTVRLELANAGKRSAVQLYFIKTKAE